MELPIGQITLGDCREVMAGWPDNCIDAIVADPPYGLEFMGKEWDKLWTKRDPRKDSSIGRSNDPYIGAQVNQYVGGTKAQEWHLAWAKQALRVLKPGGHLLAFGGTRTYHRMACAVEDAGFEIRDQMQWLYGSGFPKSLDVSKAIDKAAGAEREVVGRKSVAYPDSGCWGVPNKNSQGGKIFGRDSALPAGDGRVSGGTPIAAPATDAARQWSGWGTALKPAHEPIVLARKPLSEKNVAANVLKWATGGLNVDGCRIGNSAGWSYPRGRGGQGWHGRESLAQNLTEPMEATQGRWPANLLFDREAAGMLDEQSGERPSGGGDKHGRKASTFCASTDWKARRGTSVGGDSGGASRFFYCAKASRKERGEGNRHPTVKPIRLMRYLCRLITPRGGIVLDPFCGSGSTCIAARLEGFQFVGIDSDPESVEIARARLEGHAKQAIPACR